MPNIFVHCPWYFQILTPLRAVVIQQGWGSVTCSEHGRRWRLNSAWWSRVNVQTFPWTPPSVFTHRSGRRWDHVRPLVYTLGIQGLCWRVPSCISSAFCWSERRQGAKTTALFLTACLDVCLPAMPWPGSAGLQSARTVLSLPRSLPPSHAFHQIPEDEFIERPRSH